MPLRAPALMLALLAAAPLPAAAAPPPLVAAQAQQEDSPRPLADLQDLLRALEGWLKRFPTYSAPEVLPNGDIIIRRHLPEPPPRKPPAQPDGTDT